jgi:hypothetical protein
VADDAHRIAQLDKISHEADSEINVEGPK